MPTIQTKTLLSWLAVFASAFFFYLATSVIRWSQATVAIDPAYFVFSRFVLGFAVVSAAMAWQRRIPRANHRGFLFGRMLFNTLAVYCFYRAVDVTSVANANILNMTYPIFIALITWFFLKKQRDLFSLAIIPAAFAGIWLIVAPAGLQWDWNNLWGLASGLSASLALIFLNLGRQHDDSQTTLFYMFAGGTVLVWVLFHHRIHLPRPIELYYLVLCSLLGVGGQYLLTYGFRYVTAVEGSIISSSRILLAALLGPLVAADPPLRLAGWIGALLIFGANVVLAVRRAVQSRQLDLKRTPQATRSREARKLT